MRYLYKEYYNLKTIDERKSKANQRRRYDSTINFDLEIKPINQPEKFSLYYVPTNSTLKLAAEIARLDVILEMNYSKLPGLAQHNFFIDMLSRELFSTNELEGVKSSKEEIVRTTRSILGDSKKKPARFKNVIKSYLELKEGNLKPPVDAKDCRKIFDEITSDGISKDDYPDGKFFRREATYIYRNDKEIHRGITSVDGTEELIIEKINSLFRFMNDSSLDLYDLIKIAVSHYYFGYIHPYYDGNGRTGRFISSIFLKDKFSWLTAMSLSQGCNKERERYLKIFDTTNQISSQGEMNFFVDEFLQIIESSQKDILEILVQKSDLLNIIIDKINKDESLANEDEKIIMSIMAQEFHFNPSKEGIGVTELKPVFGYAEDTIRIKLKKLYERGLVEKIKSRPVKYVISSKYLENS